MCEILFNFHFYLLELFVLILIVFFVFSFIRFSNSICKTCSKVLIALKGFLSTIGIRKWKNKNDLNKELYISGYGYDPIQDIFYSNINPWQKKFGYCRLYDEACAPLGMIVDCEPIYFEYGNKNWLIEFWKGQYDLSTGCEIGIYTAKKAGIEIPGIFNGTFYTAASRDEFLKIECEIKKNDNKLFSRVGKHWWLTGFKVGEYSEPSELSMDIVIHFLDKKMCSSFIDGMLKAGYMENEFLVTGSVLRFTYDKPKTSQPITRTELTDLIIQRKNRLMCEKYNYLTKGCDTLNQKFDVISKKAPEIYGNVLGIGRPKQLYDAYKFIKNYL
jgi:hypothetical protein